MWLSLGVYARAHCCLYGHVGVSIPKPVHILVCTCVPRRACRGGGSHISARWTSEHYWGSSRCWGRGGGGRDRPLLLASVLFNYSAGPLLRRGREESARPGAGEGRGARRGEASAGRASQVPRAELPSAARRPGAARVPAPCPLLLQRSHPSPLHSPPFLPPRLPPPSPFQPLCLCSNTPLPPSLRRNLAGSRLSSARIMLLVKSLPPLAVFMTQVTCQNVSAACQLESAGQQKAKRTKRLMLDSQDANRETD